MACEIFETVTVSILYWDPHSLVVMDTHSQVRTAITVVRPSSRSHTKEPSSAKVAIILIPLLTCIDTSVINSMERRKPVFDTSKWRRDGTPARVTSQTYNKRKGFSSLRAVSHLFCWFKSNKLRSQTNLASFINYQLAVGKYDDPNGFIFISILLHTSKFWIPKFALRISECGIVKYL